MKLYKVEAVVLSSREMQDAHRLLTLFSRQQGKLRVVAHGVGKPSSRKRGAVQPFCYSSFLIYRGRELDSVRQCEEINAFPGLRADLDKISYASYIAELVDASTMEGEVNEELFLLLLATLQFLSRNGADIELFTRAFEVRLMDVSGLRPQLEQCVGCGARIDSGAVGFSSSAGGAVCSRCMDIIPGVKKYPRSTVEVLRLLLNWNLAKLERIKVSSGVRQHLKGLLHNYISYHLDKKFNSMQFLEQLQSYHYK